MVEIAQKQAFLTWNIQNFIRKLKQFVKNIIYLINWLVRNYMMYKNSWFPMLLKIVLFY